MSRGRRGEQDVITPSLLLRAYACGIFPMADSADDPALYWVEPRLRGVLAFDRFHVPRRLARTVRSGLYEIRVDTDFEGVIDSCAAPRAGRRTTWIIPTIRRLYGESMFSLSRDASKVALVHLVAQLKRGGFTLLDTQFQTAHLAQFGVTEIKRDDYLKLLDHALLGEAEFLPQALDGQAALEAVRVADDESPSAAD
jgi:leucyl/phenylalanyl-tRNA--protein transferase